MLSDLVVADLSEAQEVADSVEPSSEWEGFSFKGLDNVKLCTLLSYLKSGSTEKEFERFLDRVEAVSSPTEEGPVVFSVPTEEVKQLGAIAAMAEPEIKEVVDAWWNTEEFEGWDRAEVAELLGLIGDLADSARWQNKSLLLWMSL